MLFAEWATAMSHRRQHIHNTAGLIVGQFMQEATMKMGRVTAVLLLMTIACGESCQQVLSVKFPCHERFSYG